MTLHFKTPASEFPNCWDLHFVGTLVARMVSEAVERGDGGGGGGGWGKDGGV